VNKKKKEDVTLLTPGSKYHIRSLEARDRPLITIGTFRGYTALGSDEAVCIEVDEIDEKMAGKIRIIPCLMIMAIDIMTVAEAETKGEEETQHYFG
jgi:hypothetical protein